MTYYNLTFMDNMTSPVAFVQGCNSLAEGYLFTLILFLIAFVAIVATWKYDLKIAMVAILFGLTVIAALLWVVALVPFWVIGAIFGLMIMSIVLHSIWN